MSCKSRNNEQNHVVILIDDDDDDDENENDESGIGKDLHREQVQNPAAKQAETQIGTKSTDNPRLGNVKSEPVEQSHARGSQVIDVEEVNQKYSVLGKSESAAAHVEQKHIMDVVPSKSTFDLEMNYTKSRPDTDEICFSSSTASDDDEITRPVLSNAQTTDVSSSILGKRELRKSARKKRLPSKGLDTDDEHESVIPQDPIFLADKVLSPIEMELLFLGEEGRYCMKKDSFPFDFVWNYASAKLKIALRDGIKFEQGQGPEDGDNWFSGIINSRDFLVKQRFTVMREYVREALYQGYRRPLMKEVIATIRFFPDRGFPRVSPAAISQMMLSSTSQRKVTKTKKRGSRSS